MVVVAALGAEAMAVEACLAAGGTAVEVMAREALAKAVAVRGAVDTWAASLEAMVMAAALWVAPCFLMMAWPGIHLYQQTTVATMISLR